MNTNINMIMTIQSKIINKSRIRDIWTFITMGSIILGFIPFISFIVGIIDLGWFVAFIVLYFSIKNDKKMLAAMIKNLDPNEPATGGNKYYGNNIVNNWENVFRNYDNHNVQTLLLERNRLDKKRDLWTFVYLIIGFILGIILMAALFSALASTALSGDTAKDTTHITKAVESVIGVMIFFGIIGFFNWIIWIIVYITSYNSIKHIELNLTTMNFNNENHDDQNNSDQQQQDPFK